MRRDLLLILLLGAGACAYYNGLYNAGGLVKRAESAARDGKDSVAVAAWREAAAKADTVVTRYPKSRWTDDALLVSGASSALAGECAHGLERLGQWERHPGANTKQRVRATIARGACLVRRGEFARALDTLGPVVAHRDETLSRIAAAWAARAALGAGRSDSVMYWRARHGPIARRRVATRPCHRIVNRWLNASCASVRENGDRSRRRTFRSTCSPGWIA